MGDIGRRKGRTRRKVICQTDPSSPTWVLHPDIIGAAHRGAALVTPSDGLARHDHGRMDEDSSEGFWKRQKLRDQVALMERFIFARPSVMEALCTVQSALTNVFSSRNFHPRNKD